MDAHKIVKQIVECKFEKNETIRKNAQPLYSTIRLYGSRHPVADFALPRTLTKFQRYGTMMSAMPAGMLDVPTPKFRMTVGKSSAVYRGMMTLDEDTENLPAITSDSDTHSSVSAENKALFVKSASVQKVEGGNNKKSTGQEVGATYSEAGW